MGKLILCSGKTANRPFHFSLTNTNVYTIEELCYYIYHNIYAIQEELYQKELVDWLLNEVDMPEISEKLNRLIEQHQSFKDIVVSILCSADYYEEKEIKDLIVIMDEIENLSPFRKKIIKADNYLKYRRYANARNLYEQILCDIEAATLSTEEIGNIKHNLAIIYLHTVSYQEAANEFLEAYHSNRKEETLKQYLYALKIGNLEEEYHKAVIEFEVSENIIEEIESNIELKLMDITKTKEYQSIQALKNLLQNGNVSEYKKETNQIIFQWKQVYRHEIGL